MNSGHLYTEGQIAEIIARKRAGDTWQTIANAMDRLYGIYVTPAAVRAVYARNKDLFSVAKSKVAIQILKETARAKRAHSYTQQRNNVIIAGLNQQEDLKQQFQDMVDSLAKGKPVKLAKPVIGKPSMTIEMLVSDVHVGKKTDTFDLEVCRLRLRSFTAITMLDIDRKRAHYNVDRIVVALLGDLIENALMHGKESMAGCEFDNAEQVRWAIELIHSEVLVPLGKLGIRLDVVCIGGNHDRQEERPTFNNPGKNGLSWIIYQMLKMLGDRAGFKHFTWHIPEGVYHVLDIYGTKILYEHGDRIPGGNTKTAFLSQLARRGAQLNVLLHGIRVGHWHAYAEHENGAAIVNGSVPGQDSYADVNGFNSIPGQVVSYYVQTKNRDNSYWYSWLVQLGQVGKTKVGAK
jgi:hypothetical protein